MKSELIDGRQEVIRSLLEGGRATLAEFAAQEKAGRLTRELSQRVARFCV